MANKYLSSSLLFIVSCSIFVGSSSEAAKLYTSDENIESFAVSKIFALLDNSVEALKNGLAGGSKIFRLLSGDPSTLSPDQKEDIHDGLEHIREATKEIKMVHNILLTAILLWPLAIFLCCPVSCFLACIVGGLVLCVVWIVVVVLFLVGLILFTPNLNDGALPYHAASTAEMVAQTLSDICRESLKALKNLSENGHKLPVSIVLDATQFVMEQIENVGGQTKALITRAENVDEQVFDKLKTIDDIIQTLLTDINQSLKQLRKGEEPKENIQWSKSVLGYLTSDFKNYQRDHGQSNNHRYHQRNEKEGKYDFYNQ